MNTTATTVDTAVTAANPLSGKTEAELAQLVEAMLTQAGGTAKATLLRSQAIKKQQEAASLLRQADHAEYVATLNEQLAKAQAWLDENARQVDDQLAAVDQLIAIERAAQDRVRDAEENLRKASETHQLLSLEEAPASQLTDALLRVHAAREVLESLQPPANRATANREAAEKSLGGAREVIQQGRAAIARARGDVKRAEETPESAPRSTPTLLLSWQQVITENIPLTTSEMEVVRGLVMSMASLVGADKSIERRGYDRATAELQGSFNDRIRAVPGQVSQVVVPGGGRR